MRKLTVVTCHKTQFVIMAEISTLSHKVTALQSLAFPINTCNEAAVHF